MFESLLVGAESYTLPAVFLISFFSFFILPLPAGGVEAVMIAASSIHSNYLIFAVTMIGSTIGTILNYLIGIKGISWLLTKNFKKSEQKARKMFNRWGPTSIIFLGWMPVIGNPLIIVSGSLRMKFWKLMLYSTIGKVWYFAIILWLGSNLLSLI